MVLTWSLFAFMSAFAKAAYAYTNPKVTFFFQNFIGFLLVAALTIRPGFTLKSSRWPLLLARGWAGAFSFFCLFYSISRIPLTDGTVLNTTAPLFLPLFLHFWLKKKSSLKVWLGSLLGFIGVVCILKPGAEILQPAALPALFSGIGSAFVMIVIRLLAGEDAKKIVFVYLLIASASIFPFAASSLPSLPSASWPLTHPPGGTRVEIAHLRRTHSSGSFRLHVRHRLRVSGMGRLGPRSLSPLRFRNAAHHSRRRPRHSLGQNRSCRIAKFPRFDYLKRDVQ